MTRLSFWLGYTNENETFYKAVFFCELDAKKSQLKNELGFQGVNTLSKS